MTTTTPTPPPNAQADDNQLIAERREKLAALRAANPVPFPNDFKPQHRALPLQQQYGELENDALEPQAVKVTVPAA